MIGRVYLERGRPVTVLVRWQAPEPPAAGAAGPVIWWLRPCRRYAPRNVLIRRDDGSLVVRPFRSLRKPVDGSLADSEGYQEPGR